MNIPTENPEISPQQNLSFSINEDTRFIHQPINNEVANSQPNEHNIIIVDSGYKASSFDIWALGITVVIGGQYFGWNAALVSGFGSCAIATILIGLGYVCLILGNSEITSAMPFAGGSYALARCTIGFYAGFLLGCIESLQYIMYVSASAISLGDMIGQILNISYEYQPIIWMLFYISALSIHIIGGRVFWYSNIVLCFLSILILLIYCFGCMSFANLSENGVYLFSNDDITLDGTNIKNSHWFVGGITTFIKIIPLTTWNYIGVESLAFAVDQVNNPKATIPNGSIACIFTLFLTSILVLFVCSSVPPGVTITSSSDFPLAAGFAKLFNISQTNAIILSIPATYATAFGFIFGYDNLLHSMAKSNFLPKFLCQTYGSSNSPYAALVVGSILGFFISLISFFVKDFSDMIFQICVLSGFLSYISQCWGLYKLRTTFSVITPHMYSPLGLYGASYATFIFSLGVISIIGFQDDNSRSFVPVVVILLLLSIYYYVWVAKHQKLSEKEMAVFFRAQVITYNNKKIFSPKSTPNTRNQHTKTNSAPHTTPNHHSGLNSHSVHPS